MDDSSDEPTVGRAKLMIMQLRESSNRKPHMKLALRKLLLRSRIKKEITTLSFLRDEICVLAGSLKKSQISSM